MTDFSNHKFYNCRIILNNEQTFNINANWLHNENLDHWKDWECNTGYTRLNIDSNFDVYNGECFNNHLGNLITNWNLLSSPTICNQYRCTGCTDDLLTFKKEKSNVN